MNKKIQVISLVIASVIIILSLMMLSSCSPTIDKSITQSHVNDFFARAEAAENKYGAEPEPGSMNTFPSSLKITGKVLWIEMPVFEGFDPVLPAETYKDLELSQYSWYTADPSEVLYIVLIDMFYSPSYENGDGNTFIFTIVDLSYNEKIYRSFLTGSEGPPFKELAEFLEKLML